MVLSVFFSLGIKVFITYIGTRMFKSCIVNGIQFHLWRFQDLKILVPVLLSVILTKKITYQIHTYLQLMMYEAVPTQSMGSVLTGLDKL